MLSDGTGQINKIIGAPWPARRGTKRSGCYFQQDMRGARTYQGRVLRFRAEWMRDWKEEPLSERKRSENMGEDFERFRGVKDRASQFVIRAISRWTECVNTLKPKRVYVLDFG